MAKPRYTSAQWQRGMRSLIVVSVVNGVIISLLVQGRVEVLPAAIGALTFCVATIPPSLWILHQHLDVDARLHTEGLGRRNRQ